MSITLRQLSREKSEEKKKERENLRKKTAGALQLSSVLSTTKCRHVAPGGPSCEGRHRRESLHTPPNVTAGKCKRGSFLLALPPLRTDRKGPWIVCHTRTLFQGSRVGLNSQHVRQVFSTLCARKPRQTGIRGARVSLIVNLRE